MILLTYELGGSLPATAGKDAKATKTVSLGEHFIEEAIQEKPRKPILGSSYEYEIWRNWKRISQAHKLAYKVKKYVKDLGGCNPEFEFM